MARVRSCCCCETFERYETTVGSCGNSDVVTVMWSGVRARRSNSALVAPEGTGSLISGLAARWCPCSALLVAPLGRSFLGECHGSSRLSLGFLAWFEAHCAARFGTFGSFTCLVGPCCTRGQFHHALSVSLFLAAWRGALAHLQHSSVPEFFVSPRASRRSGSSSAQACLSLA